MSAEFGNVITLYSAKSPDAAQLDPLSLGQLHCFLRQVSLVFSLVSLFSFFLPFGFGHQVANRPFSSSLNWDLVPKLARDYLSLQIHRSGSLQPVGRS